MRSPLLPPLHVSTSMADDKSGIMPLSPIAPLSQPLSPFNITRYSSPHVSPSRKEIKDKTTDIIKKLDRVSNIADDKTAPAIPDTTSDITIMADKLIREAIMASVIDRLEESSRTFNHTHGTGGKQHDECGKLLISRSFDKLCELDKAIYEKIGIADNCQ